MTKIQNFLFYCVICPAIALGWVWHRCLRLKGMTDVEARHYISKKHESIMKFIQ